MDLKLDFAPEKIDPGISIRDKIILMGSCFSDDIGNRLEENKFNALINPFGTIYNPYSILHLIELASCENQEVDVVKSGDVYFDWDAHSQISATNESDLKQNVRSTRNVLLQWLRHSKWLIITPGTSWVYVLKDKNRIVANCHKVDQSGFDRILLDEKRIYDKFTGVVQILKKLNPDLQLIFTVSPVRHVRDGLVNNNLSKSLLIHVVHELIKKYTQCHYFPSYEIMMDELRDYRFYQADFIHPNDLAITYIWEKFVTATMDDETKTFLGEWSKVKKALGHRPFHAHTPAHQKFLKETISQLERLSHIVDTTPEIFYLKKQIDEIHT